MNTISFRRIKVVALFLTAMASNLAMGQELPDLVSSKDIMMTNAVLAMKLKPNPTYPWEMQWQDELSDAEVETLKLSGLAPHRQGEALKKAFENYVPLFAKKIANGFCFFTLKPNISLINNEKYTFTRHLGDAWSLKDSNHITRDYVSSKVISVPIQKVSDKDYSALNEALESEDAMVKSCVQVISIKPYVGERRVGPVKVELKFLSVSVISTKSRKELFKYPSGWLNSLADQ